MRREQRRQSVLHTLQWQILDPCFLLAAPQGRTPMMLAAEKGHLKVMQLLHRHGANVNAETEVRPPGGA